MYFARFRVRGKLIRKSLKTDAGMTLSRNRVLPGLLAASYIVVAIFIGTKGDLDVQYLRGLPWVCSTLTAR